MKISYNWLYDYVPHSLSPQALADALTMIGLEEEESFSVGQTLDGVVVGYVVERKQHPNADKLSLCQVDLGTGGTVQIVCGAPNVATGQKVPVATVGTKLMLPTEKHNPDAPKTELTIKKGKIRGEESNGMICSAMELGLSGDHSGIMVLAGTASVGTPFADYLREIGTATADTVIDINITPNRPDATCHLGVARDISAVTGVPVQKPNLTIPVEGGQAAEAFQVEIECPKTCHRYVGLLIEEVKIAPSPAWMQARLEAIGLRPRNNVVDITNYVMFECGQPLHAFDADQLADAKIVVRQIQAPMKFTTLDDKVRDLPIGTMMICDGAREVAIAGVMGGQNSEVTEGTSRVLLESAWFDPSAIRKTAKALGLGTDASYRFERGVDPQGQAWAATRAAQLMVEYAGGRLVEGMVDAHPVQDQPRKVILRPSRANMLIGDTIPTEKMVSLLEAIGFEVEIKTSDALNCQIPSWRPDIEREVDVIEEVARLYGYDNITLPNRSLTPNATPERNAAEELRLDILRLGMGFGFREVYTNSMVKTEAAAHFVQPEEVVETLNPISSEMGALRPCLLQSILPVVAHNLNHGRKNLRLMEVANVFKRTQTGKTIIKGYDERESIIFVMTGAVQAATWQQKALPASIYDVKGIIEALITKLGIGQHVQLIPQNQPSALTTYQINVQSGHQHLGMIARLSDEAAKQADVKQEIFFAELDWTSLARIALKQTNTHYHDISRYPTVERDLALVVDKSVAAGALLETIRKNGGKLLQDASIFDLYEGERIEAGKKSLAFSLRLGADRTLVDKEIDALMERIIKRLATDHQAILRT